MRGLLPVLPTLRGMKSVLYSVLTGLTSLYVIAGSCTTAFSQPDVASNDTAAVASESYIKQRFVEKACEFLLSKQDAATGGWNVTPNGPQLPAITALVVSGMLSNGKDPASPAIAGGVKFILQYQQADGGIYDKIMPGYNTSICLTTLCMLPPSPQVDSAKAAAVKYLRSIQYGEDAVTRAEGSAETVSKSHSFYGGVGYGKHGRPDLSNTQFFVEALHAAGVPGDDPAMQRALAFLARVQMLEKVTGPDGKEIIVNDMPYAKGSRQGGFIYATGENKDKVGTGQSFAGMMDESLSDGTTASRLRSYGTMSYAGFKSMLYAGLAKNDPRVVAAQGWIASNYTLDENPCVGTDGLYYYYVVFAKAMKASGESTIKITPKDRGPSLRDWRSDLIAKLNQMQESDGSMKSVDDRWMEDNKVLITAYSLNAIGTISES